MDLRPYQTEALAAISRMGNDAQILALPTGAGKTPVITRAPAALGLRTALFLVHVEELVDQIVSHVRAANPDAWVDVEQGDRTASEFADMVVASIPTLRAVGYRRLKKFRPDRFGMVIHDECVAGNTEVITELGCTTIAHAAEYHASIALTLGHGGVCWRPITAWMDRGVRDVLLVKTQSGRAVRCTFNHPFLTQRGWVWAGLLRYGDAVLSLANAAVDEPLSRAGHIRDNGYVGTKESHVVERNGKRSTMRSWLQRHYVAVAAGKKCVQSVDRWSNLCTAGLADFAHLYGAIAADRRIGTSSSPSMSDRRFSERCLATPALDIQTDRARCHVSQPTIARNSVSGLSTKCAFFPGFNVQREKSPIPALGNDCFDTSVHALYRSSKFTSSSILETPKSESRPNGSMNLGQSVWPGGFAMMEHQADPISAFTPKDTRVATQNLPPDGFVKDLDHARLSKLDAATRSCACQPKPQTESWPSWMAIFPTVCGTSFDLVTSVENDGKDRVYDLTVDESHNFFGNGLCLHNCHHAPADGHIPIWQHFGFLDAEGKKVSPMPRPLLGCTATPGGRSDGAGLNKVFNKIAYQLLLADAIKQGYLVPIHAWTILTKTSLDDVRVVSGEYARAELSRTVSQPERNAAVLNGYKEHANGTKTLIFCVDVAHAEKLAQHFNENGVMARSVFGESKDRANVIHWFRTTPSAVLTNCAVFGEGMDVPSIDTVILAAPTKSRIKFAQQVGRGTRLAHGANNYGESVKLGKSRMILIDVTDTTSRIGHAAVNILDIMGAPQRTEKLNGQDILDVVTRQHAKLAAQEVEKIDTVAVAEDLFGQPQQMPERSRFSWVQLPTGELHLSLPNRELLRLRTDLLDRWVPELYTADAGWRGTGEAVLDRAAAVVAAEQWVQRERREAVYLVSRGARWRKDQPSSRQCEVAKKLGIVLESADTKGSVSRKIDVVLAKRRAEPPTRGQKWFCSRERIAIPDGASKHDVSVLIGKHKRADVKVLADATASGVMDEVLNNDE